MFIRLFIFSIGILFFLCGIVFGQERKNAPLPKIGHEIVGRLTSARGWMLDPAGQWISRQNRIPAFSLDFLDFGKTGLGIDNFLYYELRELSVGDSSYLILFKNYRDGNFEYPSIYEGWEDSYRFIYYIFPKKEFEKFNNIVNDSVNIIKIQYLYFDGEIGPNFGSSSAKIYEIENNIGRMLREEEPNTDSTKYFVLQIAPYKSKGIVQFQLYSTETIVGRVGGIIEEHKIKENPKDFMSDELEIYFTKDLFNYCYFETDYCSFSNFIRLTNSLDDCLSKSKIAGKQTKRAILNVSKKSTSPRKRR